MTRDTPVTNSDTAVTYNDIQHGIPRLFLLSVLQELLTSIENREPAIEKISIGYTRLSPDGASVSVREVEPLRQRWEALVLQLTDHVESRRMLLIKLRNYHDQHTQVDRGLDALLDDVQEIETANNVPLRDRIVQLEVRALGQCVCVSVCAKTPASSFSPF